MALLTKAEYEQVCALSAHSLECPEIENIQTVNIIACDNLITCDQRQWHADILAQAATDTVGLIGKPFTLDHNWDEVEEVQGLIYDARLLNLVEAPPRIVQTPYARLNKKIIKDEGYRPVVAKVAFYRYGGILMQQALGALKFVSFGANSIESDLICPHDGLSFTDPACRYVPPSRWWEPSEDELLARNLKIADYAYPYRLSLVHRAVSSSVAESARCPGNRSHNCKILQSRLNKMNPIPTTQPDTADLSAKTKQNTSNPKPENEDDRLVQKILKEKLGKETQQSDHLSNDKPDHPKRVTSSASDPNEENAEDSEEILQMTESQLDAIIQGKLDRANADAQQKLNAATEEALRQKADADKETAALQEKLRKQEALAAVLQKHNVSPVALVGTRQDQNAIMLPDNRSRTMHPNDAVKELQRIFDTTESFLVRTDVGDLRQSNDYELIDFIVNNKKAALQGLELYAKKHGLLKGDVSVITQAGTTSGDISPFLLKALSTFMRMTTVSQHNWQQFVNTTVSLGKNRGDTVEVPRYAYLNCSDDPADYQIGRDDDITTSKQPISVGSESIVLGLNGLGKSGLAGNLNAPVSVAKFFQATSVYDLMGILNKVLYESYLKFLTSSIRTEYSKTSQNYYNNSGVGVTSTASMAAGCGGQLTVEFLDYMGAVMGTAGVPEFANGMYALQVGEFELLPLRKSLKLNEMAFDKIGIEELTAYLQPNTPTGDVTPISGYVGNVGRFMIFCTNTIYNGTGAMTPTTIAGSSHGIYNAYAFGADAVGRAQAMPFSMIYDSQTNFSLRDTVSWVSIEKIQAIDVDPILSLPAQAVKQQLRVFNLKLSRTPI